MEEGEGISERRALHFVVALEWVSRLRGVRNIIVEVTKTAFLPQLCCFLFLGVIFKFLSNKEENCFNSLQVWLCGGP